MKRRGKNELESHPQGSGGGFLNCLKLRAKKEVADSDKEEIEFLGTNRTQQPDEKEIKDINNVILDSLPSKNPSAAAVVAASHNSAIILAEKARLRSKYKNGVIRIQDTNGIIYNPSVSSFIQIHFQR
jgi:hypothetical protein